MPQTKIVHPTKTCEALLKVLRNQGYDLPQPDHLWQIKRVKATQQPSEWSWFLHHPTYTRYKFGGCARARDCANRLVQLHRQEVREGGDIITINPRPGPFYVTKAQKYHSGAMSSLGDAAGMILRQWNFPYEYKANDVFSGNADDDRIRSSYGFDHFYAVIGKYIPKKDGAREWVSWMMCAPGEDVTRFLAEFMKADKDVRWTGFRILGTVNRSNGNPIYSIELFSRKSRVPVYTGQYAPNVRDDDERYGDPERSNDLNLRKIGRNG